MPQTLKKPTAPELQTGVIQRNAKGQFVVQPSKEIRGEDAHRPTKYSEELQAKADQWLDKLIQARVVAWLEELCLELDIDESTLEDWATALDEKGELLKPKFSRTIKRAKHWQKMVLKNNGIIGKFNPRMSMFLLSANHDTVEKREVKADHTTGGKPIDMTGIPTATTEGVNEFITQGLKQKYIKPAR